MAEVKVTSKATEDGSDIVIEKKCTVCAEDGIKREALNFCQTCEQFLCITCCKYHQRFSKSHQLNPAGSDTHQQSQTGSRNKWVVTKCQFHPDRDIEMYCGQHDMVYCSYCIALEHRSCINVEEVKAGVHVLEANKLQKLVTDVDSIYKQLHKMKQGKSIDVKLIAANKSALLKEIDLLRKKMNDHLDDIERKVKTELEEELKKLQQEISGDITVADDLLITVSKMKPDLVCYHDDKQLFIAEKIAQKVVSDANEFLVKALSSKHLSLKFKLETTLYNGIKTADSIGKIVKCSTEQQHAERSKYAVKSHNQSNVKVGTDVSDCVIIGMCQIQDGTILIIDRDNNKLKRLDDQLNVIDFCELPSKPYGVCSISSTEVIVRYAESIQYINVDQSLSPGRKIHINKCEFCYGNSIAFCADNLWTLGEKALFVYSSSGELVKTIDTDWQGQKIFRKCNPACIAVNGDGSKVYVAEGIDRVVVFMNNGDCIYELQDQRLEGTQCVCITEDDSVLVAGYMSKNVVMFDGYGNSLGELVTSNDILSYPWSLCYDRKKCRLLVGYYHTDKIQQYALSD